MLINGAYKWALLGAVFDVFFGRFLVPFQSCFRALFTGVFTAAIASVIPVNVMFLVERRVYISNQCSLNDVISGC